jgi:hypothetical protein
LGCFWVGWCYKGFFHQKRKRKRKKKIVNEGFAIRLPIVLSRPADRRLNLEIHNLFYGNSADNLYKISIFGVHGSKMNGFYQMTMIPISVTPVWLQSLDIFQFIVAEKNNLTNVCVYFKSSSSNNGTFS